MTTAGPSPRPPGTAARARMQHLLSRARCDDRAMLDEAADWTIGQLHGEQDGDSGNAVLIVDEISDVKSSAGCAGAARQYCGAAGGVALCQVAVTLTWAAPAGHALIGRALYLPADCCRHGHGSEIFGRLIEWLSTRGVTRLELHASPDGLEMYRRTGFSEDPYVAMYRMSSRPK